MLIFIYPIAWNRYRTTMNPSSFPIKEYISSPNQFIPNHSLYHRAMIRKKQRSQVIKVISPNIFLKFFNRHLPATLHFSSFLFSNLHIISFISHLLVLFLLLQILLVAGFKQFKSSRCSLSIFRYKHPACCLRSVLRRFVGSPRQFFSTGSAGLLAVVFVHGEERANTAYMLNADFSENGGIEEG